MERNTEFAARPPVGLIAAAGTASRLGALPCSKEIYPVGWHSATHHSAPRPKVAMHYLFDHMREAGVETVYVVLREGKWDIPTYWGDGRSASVNVAYLMMGAPHGTPFTLDQAYPFVRRERIVVGFPDILFTPRDVYPTLLDQQEETGADIVLGLFPARRPEKMDMVELDAQGRPQQFVIKPKATSLTYTWICAVWTPAFTLYLHEHILDAESQWRSGDELFVGDVFQRALQDGLSIESVCFPEGTYTDIGTPDELSEVARREARAATVDS